MGQSGKVLFYVGLWGKGKDAKSAQQNGMQAYKVFEEAVAKSKIKKDEIKTTWFDLSPESLYNNKLNKYVNKLNILNIINFFYK
jgi:uncharacterized protein YggE